MLFVCCVLLVCAAIAAAVNRYIGRRSRRDFTCMNEQSHFYTILDTVQEREPDRSGKEIEQRKGSQNTHTNKATRICDSKY